MCLGIPSRCDVHVGTQDARLINVVIYNLHDYNYLLQSTIDVSVTKILPSGLEETTIRPANMSLTALCVIALSQATGLSKVC